MDQMLFKQIEFIRDRTVNTVQGLSEEALDVIPEGFNNNLRWNLGHVYYVQERFAFYFAGEPTQLPDHFEVLFPNGTKPADWVVAPPTKDVLLQFLTDQPRRIQSVLTNRLEERVKEPFTTRNGLTLSTIQEFLTYTLYHEGIHFNTINFLKRFAIKS